MRGQGLVDFIYKYRKGIFLFLLAILIPVFVSPFVKFSESVVLPELSGPIIMTLAAFFLFVGFDYLPISSMGAGDLKALHKNINSLKRDKQSLEGKLARWVEVTGFKKPDAYKLPKPITIEREIEVEKVVEVVVEKIVVDNQEELINALTLDLKKSQAEAQSLSAKLIDAAETRNQEGEVMLAKLKISEDHIQALRQQLDSALASKSISLEKIKKHESAIVVLENILSDSSKLSSEIRNLKISVQDKAKEVGESVRKLKIVESENRDLCAKLEKSQKQVEQLQIQINKANEAIKKARNYNAVLRTRNSDQSLEISRLNTVLEKLTAVTYEEHEQIVSMSNDITERYVPLEKQYAVYRQVVESQMNLLRAELEEVASIAENESIEFQKVKAELANQLQDIQSMMDVSISDHDKLLKQVENLACDSQIVSNFFKLYREEREEVASARLVINETLPAISRAKEVKLNNADYKVLNRFSKPDIYVKNNRALEEAEKQLLSSLPNYGKASHC